MDGRLTRHAFGAFSSTPRAATGSVRCASFFTPQGVAEGTTKKRKVKLESSRPRHAPRAWTSKATPHGVKVEVELPIPVGGAAKAPSTGVFLRSLAPDDAGDAFLLSPQSSERIKSWRWTCSGTVMRYLHAGGKRPKPQYVVRVDGSGEEVRFNATSVSARTVPARDLGTLARGTLVDIRECADADGPGGWAPMVACAPKRGPIKHGMRTVLARSPAPSSAAVSRASARTAKAAEKAKLALKTQHLEAWVVLPPGRESVRLQVGRGTSASDDDMELGAISAPIFFLKGRELENSRRAKPKAKPKAKSKTKTKTMTKQKKGAAQAGAQPEAQRKKRKKRKWQGSAGASLQGAGAVDTRSAPNASTAIFGSYPPVYLVPPNTDYSSYDSFDVTEPAGLLDAH
jgi:hypothetical protein